MNDIKWLDQHQPQTLQIATILLYIQAAFLLLRGAIFGIGLLFIVAYVGGAVGIANEKRYGYAVAIGVTVLVVLFELRFGLGAVLDDLNLFIAVAFDVALVALLVHPQSRSYQKIWFK